MTSAIRMARQREARKAKGLTELRIWVSPKTRELLDGLCANSRLDRTDVITVLVHQKAEQMREEEG